MIKKGTGRGSNALDNKRTHLYFMLHKLYTVQIKAFVLKGGSIRIKIKLQFVKKPFNLRDIDQMPSIRHQNQIEKVRLLSDNGMGPSSFADIAAQETDTYFITKQKISIHYPTRKVATFGLGKTVNRSGNWKPIGLQIP